MSEGDETSEEDIMAFYNQPIPANSAAKLTAKQISAFSDFLKTHIDTVFITL